MKDKVFLYKFTCPYCGKEAQVESVASGVEEVSSIMSVTVDDQGDIFMHVLGNAYVRGGCGDIHIEYECSECGMELDDLATLVEEGHMALTEEVE